MPDVVGTLPGYATSAQGGKADTAVQPGDLGTAAGLAVDTDGTLAADSDTRLPSQKAVRTYTDARIAEIVGATIDPVAAAFIFGG